MYAAFDIPICFVWIDCKSVALHQRLSRGRSYSHTVTHKSYLGNLSACTAGHINRHNVDALNFLWGIPLVKGDQSNG
jgi:deoxyadenosine/deoxycytidine kinase